MFRTTYLNAKSDPMKHRMKLSNFGNFVNHIVSQKNRLKVDVKYLQRWHKWYTSPETTLSYNRRTRLINRALQEELFMRLLQNIRDDDAYEFIKAIANKYPNPTKSEIATIKNAIYNKNHGLRKVVNSEDAIFLYFQPKNVKMKIARGYDKLFQATNNKMLDSFILSHRNVRRNFLRNKPHTQIRVIGGRGGNGGNKGQPGKNGSPVKIVVKGNRQHRLASNYASNSNNNNNNNRAVTGVNIYGGRGGRGGRVGDGGEGGEGVFLKNPPQSR